MDVFAALIQALSQRCPALELRRDERMARHTSFRVGGPVTLMALPKSEEEAAAALSCAHALGIVPFYMGNGTNLLVFTPLDANDPENTGGGYGNFIKYPLMRVFNLGLKINF